MPRPATEDATGEPAPTGFRSELVAGWSFLRNEPVLLANTLQAVVAQLTIGVLIGQTAVFAERLRQPGASGRPCTASSRAVRAPAI